MLKLDNIHSAPFTAKSIVRLSKIEQWNRLDYLKRRLVGWGLSVGSFIAVREVLLI